MADEQLATYLNDHLAGSVVAIELMEHLEKAYAGTAVARLVAGVRADVGADRAELEALMKRLGVSESRSRKATAWLTERAAERKLKLDDPSGGPLRLLEALEAVELGIDGKLALWRALAAAAEKVRELQGVDYDRLARRAEEQRDRLEPARLDAARAAFGTTG
jgi:hypothetical protein